ncbi:MAG: hypothetical protein MI785_15540 [Kiloniellales bacterium]|nr:hypothetical protein [Kiloniellales bacterium]
MANKLNVLHDKPESFSAARILEDRRDRRPGFPALLAEAKRRVDPGTRRSDPRSNCVQLESIKRSLIYSI